MWLVRPEDFRDRRGITYCIFQLPRVACRGPFFGVGYSICVQLNVVAGVAVDSALGLRVVLCYSFVEGVVLCFVVLYCVGGSIPSRERKRENMNYDFRNEFLKSYYYPETDTRL